MTAKSDAQLNAEALRRRERSHYQVHQDSRIEKARIAVEAPVELGALLGWFRREWQADFPRRLHERGVEPESALGAPRLAGAMRARMTALDEAKAATSTDYDPAHDTYATGEAPRFPMLDALERYGKRHPLMRHYLEAVAYGGFDWRRVAQVRLRVWDPMAGPIVDGKPRGCFLPDDELNYLATRGALRALWEIWSTGQQEAGRDLE